MLFIMKFPTKVPNGISQKKRDHVGLILKKHKTKRQALKQATQSDPKSNQLLTLISSERAAPSATILWFLSLFSISYHPPPKTNATHFLSFHFFFLFCFCFLICLRKPSFLSWGLLFTYSSKKYYINMEKYSRGRILKPDFLVWWREKTYEV